LTAIALGPAKGEDKLDLLVGEGLSEKAAIAGPEAPAQVSLHRGRQSSFFIVLPWRLHGIGSVDRNRTMQTHS
jgi:hypothetical protein